MPSVFVKLTKLETRMQTLIIKAERVTRRNINQSARAHKRTTAD